MRNQPELREEVAEANEDMLFADGFDAAIIGVVEGPGQLPVALYDKDIIISILMKEDDMDEQSALDFFEYNILGAYMGENTPLFATMRDRVTT